MFLHGVGVIGSLLIGLNGVWQKLHLNCGSGPHLSGVEGNFKLAESLLFFFF